MIAGREVALIRDCEGAVVPSALPMTIPSGTRVKIIQALGGTATVEVEGYYVRIENKDLDALGLPEEEFNQQTSQVKEKKEKAEGPVDIEQIWAQMRTCYDPEIPVNIVDLGLIYECDVKSNEDHSHNEVTIKMTLTAPGCSMGPIIMQEVEDKVFSVDNVTKVKVDLVFEPPWSQEMMTEAARLELGML